MMIKKLISVFLLSLLFLTACSDSSKANSIVMEYDDFGPSAMSFQMLGYPWWQWDAHGDDSPETTYDIRIIVYENLSLQAIKKLYPVSASAYKDYRYVRYDQALSYLDVGLSELKDPEFSDPTLQRVLSEVREKLIAEFEG